MGRRVVRESELIIHDGKIYHLGLRPQDLAENVFLVGDPARVDKVAEHFDKITHSSQNREYIARTGTYQDVPMSVISTGIGTDNNEIALVEMHGLRNVDFATRKLNNKPAKPLKIIRIGTAGGLQKGVKFGTLAISTYGLGLDSTGLFYEAPPADGIVPRIEDEAYRLITAATPLESRFYGKIRPYASKASPEVADALIRSAHGIYAAGITASAPGFFAPQGRDIPGIGVAVPGLQDCLAELDIDGLKVVNFEMESSLLFHLGGKLGYKCGTICPIIARRQAGEFIGDYSAAVENAIMTGLDAMVRLNASP